VLRSPVLEKISCVSLNGLAELTIKAALTADGKPRADLLSTNSRFALESPKESALEAQDGAKLGIRPVR
jgi:hypothetical protein